MIAASRHVGVTAATLVVGVLALSPGLPAQDASDVARVRALVRGANELRQQGKLKDATEQLEEAVELATEVFEPGRPEVTACMNNLAVFYQDSGRMAEAESLLRRMLRIDEEARGPDHPGTVPSLHNLAVLCAEMGRYAEAEQLLQRCLRIAEAAREPDPDDVTRILNRLATLYVLTGRHAEAEPLFRRCIAILKENYGPNHADIGNFLINLAILYQSMDRLAEAEPLYRRGLEIMERRRGPNHSSIALGLGNLAGLYQMMGRYEDAESLWRRSLAIAEDTQGPDHIDVARGQNNLANLYLLTGRYAEAEPLLRRSLRIAEEWFGPDHSEVSAHLNNLASVHAGLGRWPDAVEALDRTRRIQLHHARSVLPGLAEAAQLTFLRINDEPILHDALSLGWQRREDGPTARRSAGWVLNGKGLTQQVLAERALLARSGRDPAAAGVIAELVTVRTQLATATLSAAVPGQEARRRRELDRLAVRERELSHRLGGITGRPDRDEPWVELDEVRGALPADAVLVEIARFRVLNYLAKGPGERLQPPRYAAWVIPPAGRGAVRVIDLGAAGAIEEAVASARAALAPDRDVLYSALRSRGEPGVERDVREPLAALARLVLWPILEHVEPGGRLILSPDAALWLIPWAALPLEDGRYAIEEYPIHYVVSGRDLVEPAAPRATGRPIVMADPDFDLGAAQVRTATRRLFRDPASGPSPDLPAVRGLSRSPLQGRAGRLPGSAAEAQAILPKLKTYTGADPILYADQWALEAAFKAFQRPRVVVLSTHGFFLEMPEIKAEARPTGILDRSSALPGEMMENPLLRCGLLLAGANRRQEAHQPGDEDGVLTGLEIVGTDLRGTELVVLSACETALGTVRIGEGVAGLRQAFQLAGAQAVVATLWQVPDKESAHLMADFFDRLAAGAGKAEALRAAQLAQIQARRRRYGAAHAFFWAAYTLTGRGL